MDETERIGKRSAVENSNTYTLPLSHAARTFVRPGKRPRLEGPVPMTAAVAVAEAQRLSKSPPVAAPSSTKTSPNPATEALSALMGTPNNAVSKAQLSNGQSLPVDPEKAADRETLALATNTSQSQPTAALQKTDNLQPQTSPISTASYDAPDSIAAPSNIDATVASPQALDTSPLPVTRDPQLQTSSVRDPSKPFASPAPLLQPQPDARRVMSLPHSGLRQGTRSPSSKKHQCPFCNTEFTRHHNLKSHLLTHSQEKPYVCPTCTSRFRRLHDLKRHTKLHTGERPHVCPKCNRKFARGDALARHNKGPGGCAGRRASMGSFGGEDDLDGEDSMEGVMYNEPESMEDVDESSLTKGTPSIRRQPPSGDDTMEDADQYSRLPSTYPPIQGRPVGGIASGIFPPRPSYGPASGPGPAPHAQGVTLHPSGSSSNLRPSNPGSVFAQNPLTESPKAISPSHPQQVPVPGPSQNRMHSPSMAHFQPPSTFNRSLSGSGPSLGSQSSGPQLPPPHNLNPPEARYTLASQGAPTHPPTQPSGPPTHLSGSGPLSSHSNSLSSHGQSGPGSGDPAHSMFNNNDRIWAYVKDLENRLNSMQNDIESLKSQLAVATASQQVRA